MIIQVKELKGMLFLREDLKFSLFTVNMIVYVEKA